MLMERAGSDRLHRGAVNLEDGGQRRIRCRTWHRQKSAGGAGSRHLSVSECSRAYDGPGIDSGALQRMDRRGACDAEDAGELLGDHAVSASGPRRVLLRGRRRSLARSARRCTDPEWLGVRVLGPVRRRPGSWGRWGTGCRWRTRRAAPVWSGRAWSRPWGRSR